MVKRIDDFSDQDKKLISEYFLCVSTGKSVPDKIIISMSKGAQEYLIEKMNKMLYKNLVF